MGNVGIAIKIMPASPSTDLEKLKEKISKKFKLQDSKIEELAFGLKSLKILIITPDQGGTEKIEADLKKISGVGEVEVESVSLI